MKICVDFFVVNVYFSVYIFSIVYRVAIKFFVNNVAFSQASLYFSNNLSSFIKKSHTLSFIKISFICTHFWKKYEKRSNLFSIFVTDEIFKTIFVKKVLIRYYYFINIYIIYRNGFFILMKFLFFEFNINTFYVCFVCFYIWFS